MAPTAEDVLLTRKPGAAGTGAPPSLAPDQALIRMYGQGLGDCFLLAFPRVGATGNGAERPVYVLIDCGVLAGTPGSSRRMEAIVADIRQTTQDDELGDGRGHIDLLVITHEHWDHLSGFIYAGAREAWDKIKVDRVWMGWTAKHEPGGLAELLQQIQELQRQALAEIEVEANRLQLAGRLHLDDLPMPGLGLGRFLMDSDEAPDGSLASGLEYVKDLASNDCVYCEPGEVRTIPGTETVAYVLGPPREWNLLSRMDPSSKTPETYENPFALQPDRSPWAAVSESQQVKAIRRFLDEPSSLISVVSSLARRNRDDVERRAAGDEGGVSQDLIYRSFPFDRSFRIPRGVAESRAVNEPESYPGLASYFDSMNLWRRIDDEWLIAADAFALAANNITNNTSLVLAFELPAPDAAAERKVLLFVADAQVGNWLSWDTIAKWTPRDEAASAQAGSKPDIDDLFRRTVFYKVGHHGSHNATLKEKGVERMGNGAGLTAFVPVSPPVAHNVGWEEMPLTAMLGALSERTNQRVVLPGNVWPPLGDAALLADADRAIGLQASSQTLEPKFRKDGTTLEEAVPLWVQIVVGT